MTLGQILFFKNLDIGDRIWHTPSNTALIVTAIGETSFLAKYSSGTEVQIKSDEFDAFIIIA